MEWDKAAEAKHIIRCLKCKLCWEWILRCCRNDTKFSTVRRMTSGYRICSKHLPPIEGKIDFNMHKPSSNPLKPRSSKYRKAYPTPEPSSSRVVRQSNAQSEASPDPREGASNHFQTQDEIADEDVIEMIYPGNNSVEPADFLYEEDAIEKVPSANILIRPTDDMLYEEDSIEKLPSGNTLIEPANDLHTSSLPDPMTPSGFDGLETSQEYTTINTCTSTFFPELEINTIRTNTSMFFPEKEMKTVGNSTITPKKEMKTVGTQTSWLLNEAQTKNRSTQTRWTFPDVQAVMVKYRELQLKNKQLEKKIAQLEQDILETQKLSAIVEFETRLKNNDKMCKFYTGLNNSQLKALHEWCDGDEINYWGSSHSGRDNVKANRRKVSRKLTLNQEFWLFFLRLRSGLLQEDIAYRFNSRTTHVSRVVTTLIQYFFMKFNSMRAMMFPSRHEMKDMLPPRFRGMKNIRIIIDCAEIFCEKPTNIEQQGNSYSEYKAHTTFKVLLGCTPYGSVCFVSDLFEGSISDRAIVEKSGLIDVLEEGDLVLADRGFTVKDLMDQKGVSLKIPAFLKERDRLTPQEELATKEIAANRIFVEHTVKRLKDFRIFRRVVPQSMRHVLSQAVFVCACFQNFLDPQIS